MRINTGITEQERAAIKAYADKHGYTMKRAYTQLLRDALYDSFSIRYSETRKNIGVKFSGYKNSILTNVDRGDFMTRLKSRNGEWLRVYGPRNYALEDVGIKADFDPYFWDVEIDRDTKMDSGAIPDTKGDVSNGT